MKHARRSLLFVPADSEKFIAKAEALSALDAVILDLEDGVAPAQKDAARDNLPSAVARLQAAGKEAFVRVNDVATLRGVNDLLFASKLGADGIVLPMARKKGVTAADWLLDAIEAESAENARKTALLPMIETAAALREIDGILSASERIVALVFGAEDYTNDLGVEKETAAESLLYARTVIVGASRAHRVDAIDSPCTAFRQEEVCMAEISRAKALGFTGKTTIHPVMTDAINQAFCPSEAEIAQAKRVWNAFQEGLNARKGAVCLDGQMIDKPIALRAERTLRRAGLQ